MKFFRSTWFVALIALLLGLALQTYVLLSRADSLVPVAVVEDPLHAPPSRINWDFLSPEIDQLRLELRERLENVALREEDMRDYDRRLKAERAEIEKLKREIEMVREDLSNRLIEIEVSEQKNLKNLAVTYSGLEPADALSIFQEMDDEMVVKILAFMKPEPVGRILGAMAQTRDGTGSLAARAAAISYKLRLLRQVKSENNS